MSMQETNNEAIIGYFSTQGEKFEKGMLVTIGRSGIYHKKEDLIGVIFDKPINPKNINIIEINIPAGGAVINPKNKMRFGIKSGKQILVSDANPLIPETKTVPEMEMEMTS